MKTVGFYGVPDKSIFTELKKKYSLIKFIDLDIDYGFDYKLASDFDYSCSILKNIYINAQVLKKKLDIIVTSEGKEKCDGGRFIAKKLQDEGFKLIRCCNENKFKFNFKDFTLISDASMPLYKRVNIIMENVTKVDFLSAYKDLKPIMSPKCIFWGVPPNDFDLLKLFPDETLIYGWIRAVELGIPSDLDFEMYIDNKYSDLPIVFFVQTFCYKKILAKHLKSIYKNSIVVEIDDRLTNSTKLKLEAFLKINGVI